MGFFWKVSFGLDLLVVSSHSCNHTQSYLVYGVVVYDLNHIWVVSYHSPLGRGLIYVIGLFTVGYGGYYAKRLSLGLVAISLLCFYISIIRFFGGETTRVIPCVFSVLFTGK